MQSLDAILYFQFSSVWCYGFYFIVKTQQKTFVGFPFGIIVTEWILYEEGNSRQNETIRFPLLYRVVHVTIGK